MITLTARIDLISSNSDTFQAVESNLSKTNFSSDIGAILGSKSQGGNPLIFGVTKFGQNATFTDKVDYFIGSEISDSEGFFSNSYEIILSGNNINGFTIAFDTVNNRHPKTMIIYPTEDTNMAKEYAVDDSLFTIWGLGQEDSYTLVFNDWSEPEQPLVITGIYVDIKIDINARNMIALNRSISYRGDNKLPSYGIISNVGNLEFNDLDGEVKDYAEQLLLTSDLRVDIYLNNTLTKSSEKVGVFQTETWDYDNDNRSVSVSLKDDLEEWQNISIDGFSYDPRNPYSVLPNGSMEDLYKWLQRDSITPSKYGMLSFDELDDKTKSILTNTIIEYPLLKSGTLWRQWQKLCEVCGLYIYKNNQGRTVCTYTLGS